MGLFFAFKRVVGMAVQPLPVVFLLLLAGMALLTFTKRRKNAWLCLALGVAVLCVSSFPPLTRRIARGLEAEYEPFLALDPAAHDPYAIVVLGSGVAHPGDAAMPALTRLNDTARARLVEGVRLARVFPGARLVTSGYGMGLENCADAMAGAAAELGVSPDRIDRLTQSLDTGHEASLVKKLAGDRPVVVVTSAAHMPRTMALFREQGVAALPAPCDYIAPVSDATLSLVDRHRWRPRGVNISDSEEVWHEYMGLIYFQWFRTGSGTRDE